MRHRQRHQERLSTLSMLTVEKAGKVASEHALGLVIELENTKPFSCNGVQLNQNFVVTAKHCVEQKIPSGSTSVGLAVNSIHRVDGHSAPKLVAAGPELAAVHKSPTSDLALLEFTDKPMPQCSPVVRGAVWPFEAGASQTMHYDSAENMWLPMLSRLKVNSVSPNKIYLQGPGRRGHSGSGGYNNRGQLFGLHSRGGTPRSPMFD